MVYSKIQILVHLKKKKVEIEYERMKNSVDGLTLVQKINVGPLYFTLFSPGPSSP